MDLDGGGYDTGIHKTMTTRRLLRAVDYQGKRPGEYNV